MNELQLSLLGLGLLAIVMVVVYNRWLERKFRKAREPRRTSTEPNKDADQEEGLGKARGEDRSEVSSGRQEPTWDASSPLPEVDGEPLSVQPPSSFVPEPLPALSEAEGWVDAIAALRFYEPRNAGAIRETIEQMGAQRFDRIECYTGDAWHLVDRLPADAQVSNIRCRLQLVSRRGSISPEMLHDWMRAVESLAQVLSAGLTVESERTILERAGNLDAFCLRVDALISLNLRPRSMMPGADPLASILKEAGLMGEYPAFARLTAAGAVEFQVLADEEQGLLSLVLDFPHVNRPDLVVADMLTLARSLAVTLDADIVDDGARVLDDQGMALLANQVVRLSAALQAQGIEPGSPLARRLFA